MPRWLRLWSGPIAAAVVLAALIVLWRHAATTPPPAAPSTAQAPQVVDVKTAEVAQITIQAGTARLVLTRVNPAKGSPQWHIGGPAGRTADPSAVSSLLGSLAPLTADRTVPVTGALPAAYGLSPPQRTLALGLTGGGSLVLDIGAQNPLGDYYARVRGDPAVYLIPTTLPDALQTAPAAWLPPPAAPGTGSTAGGATGSIPGAGSTAGGRTGSSGTGSSGTGGGSTGSSTGSSTGGSTGAAAGTAGTGGGAGSSGGSGGGASSTSGG